MKIKNSDEYEMIKFSKLKCGDTFVHMDSFNILQLFMKIGPRRIANTQDKHPQEINAIVFTSEGQPRFKYIADDVYVEKVESTLTYRKV